MLHHTRLTGGGVLTLALLCALAATSANGAAFRLSFLEERPVLAETCQLLRFEDARNPKLVAYRAPVLISLNDRLIGVFTPGAQP